MKQSRTRTRFRFTIRTLMLGVFAAAVLGAMALAEQENRVMWRFAGADGGGVIYGAHFGWPVPYLRVPVGGYSHVPADWFIPGLAADLAAAIGAVAAVCFLGSAIGRMRAKRSASL